MLASAPAPVDIGVDAGSSLDRLFSQLQSRGRPNPFTGPAASAPQGSVADLDSRLDPLWSHLQAKARKNDTSLPPLRNPLQPRARPRNDGEHVLGGGNTIEEPAQASGGTQASFGHSLEPGFVPTLARVLVTGATADSNGFDNRGSTVSRPWTTSRELTCSRPTASSQARRKRPGTVATGKGKKFDDRRNQAAELKVSDIRGYSGLDDLFSSHWATPEELSRDALQSRQKEEDNLGLLTARSVATSSPVDHFKSEQLPYDSEGANATPRSRLGAPGEIPSSPPGGIKLSGASFAHALGLATEREVLANLGEEDSDRLVHLKNLKTKMQANTTISVETAMREFGKDPSDNGKDGDSDAGAGVGASLFSKRPPSPLRPGVYVGHEERARTAKIAKRMPKGVLSPKPVMEEAAAAEEETREEEMPTASKKKVDKIRQRVNLTPYLNGPKSKEDKAEDHISAEERETYALWKKKVLQCARNMKQEVDRFRFG